jgi:ElaB/YqjD/DUF883 family membrane-anchored ribosome-binding protein
MGDSPSAGGERAHVRDVQSHVSGNLRDAPWVDRQNLEKIMAKTPVSSAVDDIVTEGEDLTHKLGRQADDIIASARASAKDGADRTVSSVRQAVREDVGHVRDKAVERAEEAIDSIRDAPIKSVLYAAGIGVIIGLLLSR